MGVDADDLAELADDHHPGSSAGGRSVSDSVEVNWSAEGPGSVLDGSKGSSTVAQVGKEREGVDGMDVRRSVIPERLTKYLERRVTTRRSTASTAVNTSAQS